MDPTLVVGNARIYDDFLPEALKQELWEMMNMLPYARTDSQQWLKVWNLADGPIMRSNQWIASAPNWSVRENQGDPQHPNQPPVAIPKFLSHLQKLLATHSDLPPLKHILMIPYVWPPKSSISWHQDGGASDDTRIGAFTYYVHKEWNAEWGGEFLIAELDAPFNQIPFDNSEVSNNITERGYGAWVTPKSNRLIVNPSDMYHKVAKTTDGAAPRLTIQGFIYV